MEGWISLHRRFQEHWLWQEKRKFSKAEAWIDLLFMANHKDNKFLLGNELVTVKRGQRITSIRQLCERWGWSNTKVVQFLKMLESDGMITYKSDKKKTVITIVNYDIYQIRNDSKTTEKRHETDTHDYANNDETPDKDTEKTTGKTLGTTGIEQYGTTENRHENDAKQTQKHTNNNEYIDDDDEWWENLADTDTERPDVAEVRNYYMQKIQRFPTLNDLNLMQELLKKGYTAEMIKRGIDHAIATYRPRYNGDKINSFLYCAKATQTLYAKQDKPSAGWKPRSYVEPARPNVITEDTVAKYRALLEERTKKRAK